MKSIEIEPTELQFGFVENQPLVSRLNITNKGKSPVLFKLKTAGSSNFIVKPHRGLLDANKSVNIEITITPISARDMQQISDSKFLVSAIETKTKAKIEDFDSEWKQIEQQNPLLVQSQKIKVVLFRSNNGVKEFVQSSRVESSLKQSFMYQSVRSKVKQDNHLASVDQDNKSKLFLEDLGKRYEEIEKQIQTSQVDRQKAHQQLLEIKQKEINSNEVETPQQKKKQFIMMAIFGFVCAYVIFV